MAVIEIKDTCISVDGMKIGKGASNSSMSETATGIVLINGGSRLEIPFENTTIDGVEVLSAKDLSNKLEIAFGYSGGSSSGIESVSGTLVDDSDPKNPIINNPLDEYHQVLVSDGVTREITKFKGTIILVTNGLFTVDTCTFQWGSLTETTVKLTIVFTFNVPVINNVGINDTTIHRLPNSALKNDVWVVVYNKNEGEWDLVSTNTSDGGGVLPTGGVNDVIGFGSDGKLRARKINRDDFNMGLGRVLTTNAAGNFTGLPYSDSPLADTFAQRDVLGRLLIKDGEGDDHAVTLKQLNNVAKLIDSAVPKSGATKEVLCSDGKGATKWDVDTKYSAILGATKRPKAVHYATVNIATGMTTSSSRFLVSYDMSSIGNNIDDIYVSYNVVKAGADTQSILHPVLRQVNTAGRNLIFDLYKFTNTGQLTVGSIYDAEGAKLFIEIVDKGVSTV